MNKIKSKNIEKSSDISEIKNDFLNKINKYIMSIVNEETSSKLADSIECQMDFMIKTKLKDELNKFTFEEKFNELKIKLKKEIYDHIKNIFIKIRDELEGPLKTSSVEINYKKVKIDEDFKKLKKELAMEIDKIKIDSSKKTEILIGLIEKKASDMDCKFDEFKLSFSSLNILQSL